MFEGLAVDRLFEVVEDEDSVVEHPLQTFALGSDPLNDSAEDR